MLAYNSIAQPVKKVRKSDLRKDVLVKTDSGNMVLRLNDSAQSKKQYTLPAEIRPELYHKKGVLAAARLGDDVNPQKKSSGVQFYIVQGRVFDDISLDSVETHRLKGRTIPAAYRQTYKIQGGAPHLDQNYTIFGELVSGYPILDKIAGTKTSGKQGADKPLQDIRIQEMKMIRRQ